MTERQRHVETLLQQSENHSLAWWSVTWSLSSHPLTLLKSYSRGRRRTPPLPEVSAVVRKSTPIRTTRNAERRGTRKMGRFSRCYLKETLPLPRAKFLSVSLVCETNVNFIISFSFCLSHYVFITTIKHGWYLAKDWACSTWRLFEPPEPGVRA